MKAWLHLFTFGILTMHSFIHISLQCCYSSLPFFPSSVQMSALFDVHYFTACTIKCWNSDLSLTDCHINKINKTNKNIKKKKQE